MTDPFSLSVVMVTYHTGAVLKQAIDSVLALPHVELVLVNNGNPPGIEKKLAAWAASEPRLKLITGQGNVGFSKACNAGAREASGDFFLFLNPDSVVPPDLLAKLQHYAATLKRPFLLGARLLDAKGQDQRGARRALLEPKTAFIEALGLHAFFPKERLNFHKEPLPTKVAPIPAISGAFMFLAAEDFWHIDGFDEGYFLHVEDLDFCLRFTRAEGTIYFAPDIVVKHQGGTSDTTTEFLEKQKARGFMRYFHENYGDAYPQFILWLLDAAILARLGVKLGVLRLAGKKKPANSAPQTAQPQSPSPRKKG